MYTNPFIYKRPLQPGKDDLIIIDRPIQLSKAISGLKFGHWYVVSGGKKIGKTSFLLSLMHECRRRELGYRFVFVKAEELQQYHLAELYAMIGSRLSEQIVAANASATNLHEFKEALIAVAHAIPAQEKIMILLDSMDTLPKYLLQEFFRGLLQIQQLQTTNKALARYQFVLSGTLNTNDLQFESGHSINEYAMRVLLEDFRMEDIGVMLRRVAQPLGIIYEPGFTRALYEKTNGTGYLIQKVCYRILERAFLRHETPTLSLKQADFALESIMKEGETNVEMIIMQIEKDSQLVETLMQVLRVGSVGSSRFDPNLKTLVALGALSEQSGFYRVRNSIYENVFRDYFTTERLADVYFSQHKYERARELISQATSEQVDAKNALGALLGNIQAIGAGLEHGNTVRNILEAFMNVVDSTKNCSLMLLSPASGSLRIVDAIGLSSEEIQNFELPLGRGVAGWVAQARRYRVVRDVTDEIECPDYVDREFAAKQNLGALACFPLKAGSEVLGVINLCLAKPRHFSGSEVKMLEALAAYASLALQNSNLHESLARYFEQLAQVRAVVQEAGKHTELDSIANKILTIANQIMNTEKSYLVYRKPNTETWLFRPAELAAAKKLPNIDNGEGLAAQVLKTGHDHLCTEMEAATHYFPVWDNVRWEWAIPCNLDNEPQGCIVIAGETPLQSTPAHRHLLAMLADAVSITLSNKRLFGIAEKKTRQVITAHVIGEALSRENSLQEILNLIAAECLNSIGREGKVAFVWIKDVERDKTIIKAAEGEAFGRESLGRTISLKERSLVISALNRHTHRVEQDVMRCADYRATHPQVQSECVVPLIFRDEVLGAIDVQSFKLNDFDEQDVEALIAISHHAAVAVKIVEWCDVELKALQSLYDLGNKMRSSLEVKNVLRMICDEGLRLVGGGHRSFIVQLLDPETTAPTYYMKQGLHTGSNKVRGSGLGKREHWVLENKRHYLSAEVAADALYTPASSQTKSAMFMPIIFDEQVIGVITMESTVADDFGEKELWLVRGLANQAGVALANARLSEHLAKAQMDLAKALEAAAIEEVVAGLSHDIKNCSSLIAGETQWLLKLERRRELRFEEVRKAMANIATHVESIETITGSFKNRAYILPPELAKCHLRELIDEAAQMVAARASRQEVEIQKDQTASEVTLLADRGRLVRAFFNLMSNALDAMPEGGVLKVGCEHDAAQVRLTFSDSGSGIPEALQNKVLQAGFSTKERGYGLGLALTKRIVETDHRGRLALQSEMGRGTTIELFLPREPAPSQEQAPQTARKRTSRTPRVKAANRRAGSILLVNDDATMLNKVARLLRSAGHRVAEVESGREAVARSLAGRFDVIVLDYHLRKDESATQTARDFVPDLKKNLPTTPIILTSASMQKLGAPEMYCDFFLEINPSFWNEILDSINRCMSLKTSLRRKRAGSSRLARNNGTS